MTASALVRTDRSDALQVREIDPRADARWDDYVASHPAGLIYHHSAWLDVLEREYGRQPVTLACETVDGRIRGVLPLLETRGVPLKRGPLTGRRLSSLPRTPVAGPLGADHDATAALVGAALERVREKPALQLQLKVDGPSLDGLVADLVGIPWRETWTVPLPERKGDLRFGNSRNHARITWAVNKATRMGVSVRHAETEQDLRAWYGLYLETMRVHAVPPRPYRFFTALWTGLRPQGLMELLLAEQCAEGRRVLLAGSIFFMYKDVVFYAFSGRRKMALSLRPNDLIISHALHTACDRGFRSVDMGEVPSARGGLVDFKRKWGAEPRWLYRYYYPAPEQQREASSSAWDSHGWSKVIWRRLPLRATQLTGDILYRFL